MDFKNVRIEKILPKLEKLNVIEDALETITAQSVLAKKFGKPDSSQKEWLKFLDQHVDSVNALMQEYRALIALHMDLEDLHSDLEALHEDLLRHHTNCQENE